MNLKESNPVCHRQETWGRACHFVVGCPVEAMNGHLVVVSIGARMFDLEWRKVFPHNWWAEMHPYRTCCSISSLDRAITRLHVDIRELAPDIRLSS